ncbi:hypothetical protein QJS10_CPB15g01393 [Acorus calamus]|uniref:Uncharacterized protein n=1 Tax=Acorus calamus TaxID=4465 RepID=A0AAV9D9P5_ACOCL|nr:hypothetical protein QJS10_CPB15g01393 [Acorus calamus]
MRETTSIVRSRLAGHSSDHTSTPSPEGMPTWVDTLAGTSGNHHSPPSPAIWNANLGKRS